MIFDWTLRIYCASVNAEPAALASRGGWSSGGAAASVAGSRREVVVNVAFATHMAFHPPLPRHPCLCLSSDQHQLA